MFPVDLYVKVRRAVMVENKSERAVARYFSIHRNTVRKCTSSRRHLATGERRPRFLRHWGRS